MSVNDTAQQRLFATALIAKTEPNIFIPLWRKGGTLEQWISLLRKALPVEKSDSQLNR